MTTATAPDLYDLDLVGSPACEAADGCERIAELAVRACCGCMLLLCRPCYSAIVQKFEQRERESLAPIMARCTICGYREGISPPNIAAQVFVSVVPL